MSILLKLLLGLMAGAAALVVLVRFLEPRMAFFPSTGESTTPTDFGARFEAVTIDTADGERLRGWTLPARDARAIVLYFHGNGGNLSVWAPILAGIQARGYEVRALDYRGYGASTGRPSERGLSRDVEAVLASAWGRGDGRLPIVYWGRSLGVTMAAYAATVRRPDGLVLEAGFTDARSLLHGSPLLAFLGLFSSYRFPTAAYARRAGCPILVIHGDADSVIPYTNGVALFESLGEPKQFVRVRGGDHNDATPADARAYWTAIESFVERVRPPARS